MKDYGWPVGMGQKQNPFLQIPLSFMYHTGDYGVDRIGVETWEQQYGKQWDKLRWVNDQLPYDIFDQARRWEKDHRQSTVTRKLPTVD